MGQAQEGAAAVKSRATVLDELRASQQASGSRSLPPGEATARRPAHETLVARPEQARAGPLLGRSDLGVSGRGSATPCPPGSRRCLPDQRPASGEVRVGSHRRRETCIHRARSTGSGASVRRLPLRDRSGAGRRCGPDAHPRAHRRSRSVALSLGRRKAPARDRRRTAGFPVVGTFRISVRPVGRAGQQSAVDGQERLANSRSGTDAGSISRRWASVKGRQRDPSRSTRAPRDRWEVWCAQSLEADHPGLGECRALLLAVLSVTGAQIGVARTACDQSMCSSGSGSLCSVAARRTACRPREPDPGPAARTGTTRSSRASARRPRRRSARRTGRPCFRNAIRTLAWSSRLVW
jgi:hypothetical protein